jgi:hypothetical protein
MDKGPVQYYDKYVHGSARTKKQVRVGDPVQTRIRGAGWARGRVAGVSPTGVWIVPDGRHHQQQNQRYGWRVRGMGAAGAARFYLESSDQWRRDTAYWGRAEAERRTRRIEGEIAFQQSARWAFLIPSSPHRRRKADNRAPAAAAKVPEYMKQYSKPVTYKPPPNYAIPMRVGSGPSSTGAAALAGQSKPKKVMVKATPPPPPQQPPKEETPEEMREREKALDEEFREKMRVKLEKEFGKERRAAEDFERALDMLVEKAHEQARIAQMRGMLKAEKRRRKAMAALGIQPRAKRMPTCAMLRPKSEGFRGGSTVVKAGETIVIFDRRSGTATIVQGPATFQMTLSEVVLDED